MSCEHHREFTDSKAVRHCSVAESRTPATNNMKPIVVLISILSLTVAQREDSLKVIDTLRQLQPAYRDLQNFVVSAVANAKLNSTGAIYDFHSEIFEAKDNFLRSAITLETNALRHINGQTSDIDGNCLAFLRNSIEVNLNIAGVSFTNCINAVDARLNAEIDQIYDGLQFNESSYTNASIYKVFRGQNIFVNPQGIVELLQGQLTQLQQTPTSLVAELGSLIDGFRVRLDVIRGNYRQCLTVNDQLLQTTINTVLIQLQQICLGALVPAGSETPQEPPSVGPVESYWNFV
ncbi:uncharacterized protein LOC131681933 [Topomyia yanbarensis]|uniref:uncharacterized protein LOC131681933 n=1 Tax=Topomyia yanbarensis TaxID=2498891 RepID=UPI00273B25FA|nr:uncharacterized protein LOC131681933 [Topomyia yanbarensis]